MKFVKRFILILFIAVSAVVFSNVKSDYSCSCGTVSFPFSLIIKIFDTAMESPAGDTHKPETDGAASLLGGVAFAAEKASNIKVTFIELGSVNCIPCRMMQPVIKQIEQKYGSQVEVVFHDVWTKKGAPYARIYGIRAIPTQVYLDSSGKEFFRHEGFHPFEEIEKILKKGGVQ